MTHSWPRHDLGQRGDIHDGSVATCQHRGHRGGDQCKGRPEVELERVAPVRRAVRYLTSNRHATIPRATLRCSWDTVKMPRTRRDLEREAKIDEVLEVAEDQLLAGGFESLSVAGVARELGIAQNAVYWYFPSRDHLFVATLERILARVLTTGTSPSHDQGPAVLV